MNFGVSEEFNVMCLRSVRIAACISAFVFWVAECRSEVWVQQGVLLQCWYPVVRVWFIRHSRHLWIRVPSTFPNSSLRECRLFLLGIPLWAESPRHGGHVLDVFGSRQFSMVVVPFRTPTCREHARPTPSPSVGIVSLFNFSHSRGRMVVSQCGFNLHFPMTNDIKNLHTWKRL